MTGASKILTVSYGTFSCTLEGFDDPFNTMKAIAEYFRDLAAGDRYFGAEPPTPDAAMLHRIAEREIRSRVEAKIQDNGVILRAGEAADLPAAEPPRPALLDGDSTAESVAARLQRIRARHTGAIEAATTTSATIAAHALPEAAPESYDEDEHAEAAPLANTVIAEPDHAETPDESEALAIAETDLAAADLLASALIEDVDQTADLEAEAAVLAGLMEDLPEDAAPLLDTTGEPVDLPEDMIRSDDSFDEDAFLSALAADDADTAVEVSDKDHDDLTLDELLAEEIGAVQAPNELVEDKATPVTEAATFADYADADDLTLEEQPEPTAAPADTVIAKADQPAEPEAIDEPEPALQPAARARARVIRIRRADPAPAEAPVVAEVAPEPAAEPEAVLSAEAEAALQAELAALEAEIEDVAEAVQVMQMSDDLGTQNPDLRALQELVAELSPSKTYQQSYGQAFEEIPSTGTSAEDDAVSRLIALANSEMDGEETRRRQSAIAHLKAAVVATHADRALSANGESAETGRLEPYRDDLERAVRPRRPVSETTTPCPPRDLGSRPTPLVLVSAQRIDAAAASKPRVVMPVRPRRVSGGSALQRRVAEPESEPQVASSATALVMQNSDQTSYDEDDIFAPGETENVFADATSFQDFADQLGAVALPDLLEAAAVYCAEILQRPEFSRPLVMRQLSALPNQSDTAREDYLRGFGTLLRQGRITKVKRGMFALTDRSPYLAEARKLAG